jgi:hypothetical protein
MWTTSRGDQKCPERHAREGSAREVPTTSRAYTAHIQNSGSQRTASLAPPQQQPQTRAFLMPRLMPSHYTAPGILKASEFHRQTMQGRLSKILEEHLWRPIDYPDRFKPNLKLDSSSNFCQAIRWVIQVFRLGELGISGGVQVHPTAPRGR